MKGSNHNGSQPRHKQRGFHDYANPPDMPVMSAYKDAKGGFNHPSCHTQLIFTSQKGNEKVYRCPNCHESVYLPEQREDDVLSWPEFREANAHLQKELAPNSKQTGNEACLPEYSLVGV